MFVWYFFTINNIFIWKRCKCQPRVLNVKKTRCSVAPSMRSEALCEQITSGDVSGCVAFWFVKSPVSLPNRTQKEEDGKTLVVIFT